MSNYQAVKTWHKAFGVPVADTPKLITEDRRLLRAKLIDEEQSELLSAMHYGNMIEIADGLADLLYVVYGTAVEYGIDADKVFAEVQRSNMSKLGEDGKPVYREDGKVLKGPHYFKPDIEAILLELGWDGSTST